METVRVENTVKDFEEWKAVFDKFDRFRADSGVRSYRLARQVDEPHKVTIDLDFDSHDEAIAFRSALEQIWQTPQSREQLVSHEPSRIFDVVVQRQL
jgi:hypothetical protein